MAEIKYEMKRVQRDWSMREIVELNQKMQLCFEYTLQRERGQWTKSQMSLLIHSILIGMEVPPVYFEMVINEEKKAQTVVIIDGVQRLSTIIAFINNEFALTKDIEDVEMFGKTYHIAGCKFKKLPKELQDLFLMRTINARELVNYTDDQIEEQFYRLNNGSEFTKQQIATVKLGCDLVEEFKPVLDLQFWNRTGLTKAQKKHGVILSTVLQTMMLMTNYNYGSKLGVKQVCEYAEYLNDIYANIENTEESTTAKNILIENINKCKDLFIKADRNLNVDDYINKWLKPINIPIIINFINEFTDNYENSTIKHHEGDKIITTSVNEKFLQDFLTEFIENVTADPELHVEEQIEYLDNCGKGTSNREKVEGRLQAVRNAYDNFCENEERGILADGGDEIDINRETA